MATNPLRAAALLALAGVLDAQLPPGIQLPELIPVHTAPDDPAGGAYGLWAAGRDYKVSFHDGMTFHPASATRPHDWFRWRTTAVQCGGKAVAGVAATPRLRWTDTRVELDHGAVVEAYDVRPEGVEQSFVLTRSPGQGALRIEGRIEGGLRCEAVAAQVGPLRFGAAAGGAAVRYGAAVALDARGQRGEVTTSCADGRIVLTVDQHWLRSAEYPLVIDPMISDGSVLSTTTARILSVDLYRDDQETERNLWLTWTVASASGDLDLVTVRVAEQAPALGAVTVFADITTNWDAQDGRLAGIGGPGKVVTAFVRAFAISGPLPGSRQRMVRWHVHAKDDLTLSTTAIGINAPSQEHHWAPVVGGTETFALGRFALLVFQRERAERFFDTGQSDVLATVLDLATSSQGVAGPILSLGTFGDRDEGRPTVNREALGGTTPHWLVAWQSRGTGSDDIDILIQTVDATGLIRPFVLSTEDESDSTTDKLDPILAGQGGRYLLAYRRPARDGSIDRVRVQRIDWADGAPSGSRPHPAVTLDVSTVGAFELGGLAFDNLTGSHWALTYAQEDRRDSSVRLSLDHLGFRGRRLDSFGVYLTSTLAEFRHAGSVVFNDDAQSFPLAFATKELGRDEIHAHRLTTTPVTAETRYGVGCAAAVFDWDGLQRVGSEFEGLRLRSPAALSAAVILLGTQPTDLDLGPAGLPGCRLLVDVAPTTLLGLFAVAPDNGVGLLPLPLLEEYPGITLRAQAFCVEGTSLVSTRAVTVPIVR